MSLNYLKDVIEKKHLLALSSFTFFYPPATSPLDCSLRNWKMLDFKIVKENAKHKKIASKQWIFFCFKKNLRLYKYMSYEI